MSFQDRYQELGAEEKMLHGSDVPKKLKSIEILVDHIREPRSKKFNAVFIIEMEKEVYGCKAVAINKTNSDLILAKFGLDLSSDIEELDSKIAGKKITFRIKMVNNPNTNTLVRGLEVA